MQWFKCICFFQACRKNTASEKRNPRYKCLEPSHLSKKSNQLSPILLFSALVVRAVRWTGHCKGMCFTRRHSIQRESRLWQWLLNMCAMRDNHNHKLQVRLTRRRTGKKRNSSLQPTYLARNSHLLGQILKSCLFWSHFTENIKLSGW